MGSSRFRRGQLPDPSEYFARELGNLTGVARDGWASALCPFHEDRRPSLAVNLRHGGWHCFAGCGRGDLLAFHQKKHGLSFIEAAKDLGAWGPA